MQELLREAREHLAALWDCTCPPRYVETPGGVAAALNRYDRCPRCKFLDKIDAALQGDE